MSLDPLLPIAPARVKALLLPLGQVKVDRFASFVDRLQSEDVVHLRDITADGRPNRNMFSPLAYPDGAMIYHLITHTPPASHLALTPFDLYREPLVVVAVADGRELEEPSFNRNNQDGGSGPSVVEKNLRGLYQQLEDLRDQYPKALVHQVLIFDYTPPADTSIPIPEGIFAIPPVQDSLRTTIKTVMCIISSHLLAEMTTLAKSFVATTNIESPTHYSGTGQASGTWTSGIVSGGGATNGLTRRNSQYSTQSNTRSSSVGVTDRSHVRMSMPVGPSRPAIHHSVSNPIGRPATPPVRSGLSSIPMSPEAPLSDASEPRTPEEFSTEPRAKSHDRVSIQGFGQGSVNDRWRLRGKGRSLIVIGSMYLQAGRWSDSLKELAEGAAASRSLNDYIWQGKALELMLVNLLLLGWSGLEFAIPAVCHPTADDRNRTSWPKTFPPPVLPGQPPHLRKLQLVLPELLGRIITLYSKKGGDAEKLPSLPLAETTIRFSKILAALHMCGGELNKTSLDMIVSGELPAAQLTACPRLNVFPSRQYIVTVLFEAFPASHASVVELLTTADRASILSGIAAILGPLGLNRKKAMVIRELVSVLISGLVEARTRGAADAGVHPAAGLVSLAPGSDPRTSGIALDLGEGDIESGIEAFLELLCRSYGIVGHDGSTKVGGGADQVKDSDEAIVARIHGQSSTRFFGFPSIKLNILRACINFSEALPDLNGVLKFSGDLLRTSGSGIAPGPRREDPSPMIHGEEQARLVANISRTSALAGRLGLPKLSAEYWDEFLVRSVKLQPLPPTRIPIPHAHSVLPGAAAGRASQDVDPFIYNPFLKKPSEVVENYLVVGELATFQITMQNSYDMEIEIESARLETTGIDFEALPEATRIGPHRTLALRLMGRPKEPGQVKVTGALVKVRGCRERRFPVFSKPWRPLRDTKLKSKGVAVLEGIPDIATRTTAPLNPESLSLNAIQAQPFLTVKSMTLPQASVMILEGERRVFSITLQNQSQTPVDFMLFSFKDSTQAPLQAALNSRDAGPAELHEYELILMKKQTLRLPKNNQQRNIAAGGEATFEFEILGKPGLTSATIQIDYTHLGVPRDEVKGQFYTRQISVDLTVTVNASVELARVDVLPISGDIPHALWEHVGVTNAGDSNDYCLLSMDLRNCWPSHMMVNIETDDGVTLDESILPGNTTRVIMPIKRIFLEDPHASIPSLNPSRDRQFVVSTSKISPEAERANREAFWYREKLLERIKAKWYTTSRSKRSGTLELRSMRLAARMVDAIKVEEVGIEISIEDSKGSTKEDKVINIDNFMQLRILVTNNTTKPISPLIRLMPALCHRPPNIALDYNRKLAWNGTLQRRLPLIKPHSSEDFVLGVTALCRGDFEFTASVEEVQVWEPDIEGARKRSDSQIMADAALGIRERRIWYSRVPFVFKARDGDEEDD